MISSRVFPLHSQHTANCFCRYFGNITSDISGILKKDLERIKVFHDAVNLTAVCYSGVQHLLHLKSKSKILRPIEIMGFFYEFFCQI